MNLQDMISDPRIMRLGMFFSRHTPQRLGIRLAWWAAGVICRLKPTVHQIVQANLGQVLGPNAGRAILDRTTRRLFYTGIRSYYDFFRSLPLPPEGIAALVELPEATKAMARSLWNREKGTVFVFPHLSNFDLGGYAIASHLPEMQLLTLPDPPPGFQLFNEFRQRSGVKITPLSSTALRQAISLLRRGGIVSVAGDRPVSELDEAVPFFGRPARVPSGHIRLALKTDAAIAVGYCVLSYETHKYVLHVEPPMELIRTGNRDEEVRLNLRRILDALEEIIRRWPEQWLMFVPVWPELLKT